MSTRSISSVAIGWVRPLANAFAILVSLAVIVYGFMRLFAFMHANGLEYAGNDSDETIFFGGVILGLVYFLITGASTNFLTKAFKKIIDRGVYGFTLWIVGLALIPLVTCLYIDSRPFYLSVPEGHLRIMEGGYVLAPNQVVPGNRYRATSTVLPLQFSDSITSWTVRTPSGDAHVVVTSSVQLRDTPELRAIASARQADIRLNSWAVIQGALRDYLSPSMVRLIGDVELNRASGSAASLKLRLTELLRSDTRRPSWLAGMRISDVTVTDAGVGDFSN